MRLRVRLRVWGLRYLGFQIEVLGFMVLFGLRVFRVVGFGV